MAIFSAQHLVLDVDVKSQKEALEVIAKKAKELNITNNVEDLVKDLLKRESVSTTAMTQGIAIPHAMNADFNEPAVIVARFKTPIDWKAPDNEPVKIAFALLIPEKSRGTLHMQYLQNIALALLDQKFVADVLSSTDPQHLTEIIDHAINHQNQSHMDALSINKSTKGLIVGVSACATGVAHTFMAREALEKHGKDIGYDVWIETHGQSGAEHVLTSEMIAKADYVIIAADINVELDRFAGKKIYSTNTNEAINTPVQALQNAINKSTIVQSASSSNDPTQSTTFGSKTTNGFMKHFLNGVSHMIPFIVFSGILYSVFHAVMVGVMGESYDPTKHPESIWYVANFVCNIGFNLFIAVMGGYIAVSIAGRAAFAPAMIGSMVAATPSTYITYNVHWMQEANTGIPDVNFPGHTLTISGVGLGIIAALMMGFSAGWLVQKFNAIKVHPYFKPVMPIIIIPVVVTLILVIPFLFCLSGLLGAMMNWIGVGIALGGTQPAGRIAIGVVLGFMVGFDMGGPVNKIAVATATTLIPIDPSLMGAVSAAIPICSLGCAFTSTVIGRKYFNSEEKGVGITAYFLGFMGISEGAIPFAAKRFKQTFIANVVGSTVAGLLASSFFVGGHVGMWGGLILIFTAGIYCGGGSIKYPIPAPFSYGGEGSSWQNILISSSWYLLAIVIGTLVHAFVYLALIRSMPENRALNRNKAKDKEEKNEKVETQIKQMSWWTKLNMNIARMV